MSTLFSRLFSYRQNDKLSPAETFLTEILGYSLEKDLKFQKDFLTLIGLGEVNEALSIYNQNSYSTIGGPDLTLPYFRHVVKIQFHN